MKREIKDVIDGMLYGWDHGLSLMLKIKSHLDQILSFNVGAEDRREESGEWCRILSLTADHELYNLLVKIETYSLVF